MNTGALKTKIFASSTALCAMTLVFCSAVTAQGQNPALGPAPAPAWSSNVRIRSVIALESYNIVRIEINSSTLVNPAGCALGLPFVDVQLNTNSRTAEEQRQILNAINMAFMTGRNVRFLIRDDICSIAATSSNVRIAVGVRVFN